MNFKNSLTKNKGGLFTSFREDEKIEFKKSLQLSGESISKTYLKTISGFANNQGGHIVFGIDPVTNQLLGIKDSFEHLDNKYFSTGIKDGIDGIVDFKFETRRYEEIIIGILEIKECQSKPVILKTNFDNDGEKGIAGEIYFRYPAQTTKIHASDLRALIEHEVNKRTKQVLNQINKVVDAGTNSAILNTSTGEIDTNGPTKIIMDPETLQKLNLIREGQFSETEGAPAYIIKGELELESSTTRTIIEKTIQKAIHSNDIYSSFINQECIYPDAYLKEIVFQSSHYFPCYFFISKMGINKEKAIDFLMALKEPELMKATRGGLIKRLEGKVKLNPEGSLNKKVTETEFDNLAGLKIKYGLKGAFEKTIIRSIAVNCLMNLIPIPDIIANKYLKESIQALSFPDSNFVKSHRSFILSELRKVRDLITTETSAEKSIFKKTICIIDEHLYS